MVSVKHHRTRGRDAGALIAKLRLRFVDSSGTRPNAWTNIGKSDGFQKSLDGAIFAVLAMKSQESNVKITLNQSQQRRSIIIGIDNRATELKCIM